MSVGEFSSLNINGGNMTVDENGEIKTAGSIAAKGDIVLNSEKIATDPNLNLYSLLEKLQEAQFNIDTGWQYVDNDSKWNIASFENFGGYTDGKSMYSKIGRTPKVPKQTPAYRKIGNIVYIRGTLRPVYKSLYVGYENSGSGHIIFTLPEGFRPPIDLAFACPSSGNRFYNLFIDTGGIVQITRLRGSTTANINGFETATGAPTSDTDNTAIEKGYYWFPFCVSFPVS